jgi:hypothetical protein
MKHLFLLLMLFVMVATLSQVRAQSLVNTNWNAYLGDPLNDTMVLHIKSDSSFVTDHTGTVLVRSVCKISGDTISLSDIDGQYACPNMTGKYKVAQASGVLSFILINDPCDDRAGTLSNTKWKMVPDSGKK